MTAAEFAISAARVSAPQPGLGHDQVNRSDRTTRGDQAVAAFACTVRTAPQREPQFDDEPAARPLRTVPPVAVPLTAVPPVAVLPVAPELPFPPPSIAPSHRRLTLVPLPPRTADDEPDPRRIPARTERGESEGPPDPTRFGRQFAQGLVEVLSGRRPVLQLTRHVSPAVQRGLSRTGAGHQLRSAVAPVLHSLHLSEPADGVCEMSAIVAVGPRYRAVAARLEWKIDHWLCTALQVG